MPIDPDRLTRILQPRSVAIAGASERDSSAGGAVLKNLLASGFSGRIVPVHPRGGAILDLPVSRTLAELSEPCDLAIVAVRADSVQSVIRAGIASGHGNFLVLPGGFQEAGPAGLARDAELRALAVEHGLLIMGPNCAGLINILDPQHRFAGTFFRELPFRGLTPAQPGVAFVSQSGALAEEVIASSHVLRIPVGCLISVGNGMQLGLAEFIAGLAANPHCGVIAFYAESFGDPDQFIRVVHSVSRRKPVIGLIGGTTAPGAAAALRHTGSKALANDEADDLCARAGIVRVGSMRGMLLAAKALAYFPNGIGAHATTNRVLILSNSGGPGVLTADRCQREGLQIPELPSRLASQLKDVLPAEASVANPLDLLADAREDRFGPALSLSLQHARGAFDAILMIHVVPFMVDAAPVIDTLAWTAQSSSTPILHSMMGTLPDKDAWFTTMERAGVPMFSDVEEMAIAAGALARRSAVLTKV